MNFITDHEEKTDLATKDFVRAQVQESKWDVIKVTLGVFLALALMIIGVYLKH